MDSTDVIKTTTTARTTPNESTNGQVVMGDLEYDGRVILYIIKGFPPPPFHHFPFLLPPTLSLGVPTSFYI